MAKEIEPKLVTIGDYLKLEEDINFIIPEYQRKYAWEITNCDKLWSDIKDFMDSERKDPYFFGTVIISCSNEDKEFNLIDGQQRTTTMLILLKALLMKVNEKLINMVDDKDSEPLKNGLKERRRNLLSILYNVDPEEVSDEPNEEKDRKICEGFNKIINKSNQEIYNEDLIAILKNLKYDEIECSVTHIPYKQKDNKYTNFFRNFKHFYFKEELNKIDFLNKFTKTLLDKCQIIRIKSWKVDQAIEMFNSLNSDGMPLNDSDIIYSKMFAKADEDNRKILGEKWKYLVELTNDLESKKIINLTGLLNQKMYLYRALNKDIINAVGNIDVTTPGLRKYYTDINSDLIKKPIDFCNELLILAEIWNIVKDRTIMKVLFAFNDNSKIFLASYFNRYNSYFTESDDKVKFIITDDNRKKMIDDIENIANSMLKLFSILSLVDTGYSSSNFKTFLYREELKLVNEKITNDEINDDFVEHIRENWTEKNIKELLKDYPKNDIVYLNEYLFAKENKCEFEILGDIDIEHIMPQSGKNIELIKVDAQINDEEMFNDYINKIGNKILLEYNINRTIGNEWFRTKVLMKVTDKIGYVDSKYPIAKSLVEKYKNSDKPFWTKDDIDHATDVACNRITNFIFE
ncbi:MAG: DUF262 domain-containing HNH endonuclease family protein [bacterium]|nr:DUF262 domain-containing HNH endonuclease family protein [bacterium]